MKGSRKWKLGLCVLVVVIGIPMIWLFSTPLGYLLFPPTDLYTPLVLEDLDLSSKGTVIESKFSNKYKGRHHLGIYVNRQLEYGVMPSFLLKITISGNNGVILEKIVNKRSQFWGWEQGKSGVDLLVYKSPDELPLDKRLLCRVEVLVPDPEFSSKYGGTKFFVRKKSDI